MPRESSLSTVADTPHTATAAIQLHLSAAKKLNLAAFENAVPVLHELVIANATDSALGELTVHLVSEPPFIQARTWNVDAVGPGERYHLRDLDVQLDGALFSRLTEAQTASLRLELRRRAPSEELLAQHASSVELLARNQWGGLGHLPEMVAAFVQPNDPAIDRLLKSAALALQAAGKSSAIDGYQQGAKHAWELASGLWAAVLQRKLHYALPPASFEHTGQKVRSPSQVLDSGLATCLDLTLLFAACLEQAHLHPLLVVTRGHAFVGVWLRDESFAASVVDDITAVRKRLKLQELLVFETTLAAQGQAVGFSQAIAQAHRQLSEEEEDTFELVIDVKRARMSRIKPLAQAHAHADLVPGTAQPESNLQVEDAPDLPEEAILHTPTAALDPHDRLARWQRKLLDLSLRNALLNFKPGKKALPLNVAAPALEDALAQGQALKLLPSPVLMQGHDPRSQRLHEARNLHDLRKTYAADAFKRAEVLIDLEASELESRLVELYRSARNALQEGGANTLFIALGFLIWSRPDKPDGRIKAPLILLPVTLNRQSARTGFTLQEHADEALFNPTLVQMLRQDFQLELGINAGDLPRDAFGLDIASLWTRVRSAIKDIRGWEVSEDVVLAMFSFAKYLMWKDLTDRTDDLRQSPVVKHLLDSPHAPYPSTTPFPDVRRLDQDYTPQQVFSPLPADSSQLSAVMAAAQGKDFVLIGPPGTGKSQTIANLIAQCLAQNKRVLFVAEKIAALEVVFRRLREIGLGEFCLELHSNKSRKLEVLQQLQKAWQAQGSVDAAAWEAQAQQLGQVRAQLSTYVQRLHHRHDNGWTVYQAIGCVVQGDALARLELRWDSPRAHDSNALAALRDHAKRLQAHALALGSTALLDGPLTPMHATDWSAGWQQEVLASAHALQATSQDFLAAAQALEEKLGVHWPALQRQNRCALGVLAKALPLAAHHDWSFCARPDSDTVCAALQAGYDLLCQHRALSATMSAPWPAALQRQLAQALDLLDQRRTLHAELGTPWPPGVCADIAQGLQWIEEMNALRATLSVPYGAGAAQLHAVQLQRDWAHAHQTFWPLSWWGQRKVRRVLEGVIEDIGVPRVTEDLATLVRLQRLRQSIEQLDPGPLAEGVWAGLKTRLDHARSALHVSAALQSARRHQPFTLEGLEAAADGHCGKHWAYEVQRLKALSDLDRRLAHYAALTEPSHGLWQGHDTDTALLRAALAFERERLALLQRGTLQAAHAPVAAQQCGLVLQQQHTLLQQRAALEARLLALSELSATCPGLWNALESDGEAIARALKFHASLKVSLSSLGLEPSALAALYRSLHQVLGTCHTERDYGAALGAACQRFLEQLVAFHGAIARFSNLAAAPEDTRRAWAQHTPADWGPRAAQLAAHLHGLHAWCAWRSAQTAARQAGLGTLVHAIETGAVAPAHIPSAFEVNYARWWLAAAVEEDAVLKRFTSAEHELRIQEFRALDDAFTQVSRAWIRAQLCAQLPAADSIQRHSEWGILRHEISKKKQHKPLRQLLQETASVVLRLTPCWLMSPLSIAQYLGAQACNFDLVVFDEASQMTVWDAIGAMARGKQVVMVGDPKQLPPTDFFSRSENTDPDEDVVEDDLESILDECLGASLPTHNLSWHYRSRHESLIAFSNHRYYGGGLVTFPSPITDDRAVSLHLVPGCYEKGGARTNLREARALVADLVARLKNPDFRASGRTLGVVTFNTQQQGLIEDLLDDARRKDPELEPYFTELALEPVFVKNLESVQGDERDIMYFSITYGPDMAGTVSMNFGPLNRDGGERRLNVAVTRARHELRVFSSLRGEQMDLSRTKAHGVRDLKHFLEFAELGPRALAEAHHGSPGDFESPFESSVAAALERKGWQVHTQIGASAFRIDLGVVHPDVAGRYLAGLECDGATYHRSATARDRDKLREHVLRGLGWNIVRIWSTDWWVNPGGTLQRVHEALGQLLEKDRAQQALPTQEPAAQSSPAVPAPDPSAPRPEAAAGSAVYARAASPAPEITPEITPTSTSTPLHTPSPHLFQASQPADAVPAHALSAHGFYDPSYDAVLQSLVAWVVQQEGPVLDTVLARRIARAHGFQRTGSRIQERVEQMARRLFQTTAEASGTFYWPPGIPPQAGLAFRWPAHEDHARSIDEICDAELWSLARWALGQEASPQEALGAMVRAIGRQKTKPTQKTRLETALQAAAACHTSA